MEDTMAESTAPLDASKSPPLTSPAEEQDGSSPKDSRSEDSSEPEKDERKRKRGDLVPPWKMFRFADPLDALLIFLGTVGAVGIGAALPGHMLLFGTILNNMINYSILSRELVPNLLYVQQNCTLAPGPLTAAFESGQLGHFCFPISADASSLNGSSPNQTNPFDQTLAGLSNALFGPPTSLPSDYSERLSVFAVLTRMVNQSALRDCDSEERANILNSDKKGTMSFLQPLDDAFFEIMVKYSLVYLGIAAAALLLGYAQSAFWNTSSYRQGFRIRQRFFASLMYQDISWYDTIKSGALPTRLADDVEKIQSGIGEKIGLFLQYVTTFLLGYTVGFVQGWKLTLVLISIVPLLLVVAVILTTVVAKLVKFEQKNYASAGAIADEVLSAIRTVAAFGGEDKAVERYGKELVRARRVGIIKSLLVAVLVGLLFLILFGCYALAFGYGSVLIANCETMAGNIVTVFLVVLIGTFSLGQALPELETFASAMGAASFIYKTIDRVPEINSRVEDGEKPEKLRGDIEFRGVQFNYPARPDVEVLVDINFTAKVGQTVALVGPSGCGKSTVIQLLQRFYDPAQGQVLIDGRDAQDYNLKWLREQMGIVSQEPNLFATTIAENIRYGREGVTQEEIEAAAKAANAHNFIMSLPDKYETLVGSRGTQMSGGQKQRIAIARALVRDPKILLLDEATSALDNESEAIVQAALDKARMGRTTIVIAHRLSTIRTANMIAGIKGGRVVEMDTHDALMERKGLYCELVMAQTSEQEAEQSDDQLATFKAALERPKKLALKERKKKSQKSDGTPTSPFGPDRTPYTPSGSTPYTPGHTSYTPSGSTPYSPDQDGFEIQKQTLAFASMDHLETLPEFHSHPSADGNMVEYGGREPEESAKGRKSMGLSRFMEKIRFKKREEEDKELPPVPWKELLKLNLPDWYLVIPGVLSAGAIGALFPVLAVVFSGALESFGSINRDVVLNGGLIYSMAFLGIAAIAGSLQFAQAFFLGVAGERLTKRLRLKAFQAMVKQDIEWFDDRRHVPGALTARLAVDATEVKGATGLRFGTTMQLILGVVVAIIVAFEASWQLSMVVVSLMPFVAIAGFFQLRLQTGRAGKNKERFESTGQISTESIENIRTVQAFGLEKRRIDTYYANLRSPVKWSIIAVLVQGVVAAIAQSLIFLMYTVGFAFGGWLMTERLASYDDLYRVFIAVVVTSLSLGRAASFAGDLDKAKIAAARLFRLFATVPKIDPTSDAGEKLDKTLGKIDLENVSFSYPTRQDAPVLCSLNLTIQPGKTVALVGPSGCGKSTVVSLIERFYDPEGDNVGAVRVDGRDIRNLNVKWLRSNIGIVSQEPVLFDASIAENIRYGVNSRVISDSEVEEAARNANIHTFITSLPQGYETNVGPRGTQLSGGQKQRIAIARALVRDPKILLLDEATSALDSESEKIVQEALDRAQEGRTSIVIAHRLSTIQNADQIVVIHDGKVLEKGTHSSLMARRGAYYLLRTVQSGTTGTVSQLQKASQAADARAQQMAQYNSSPKRYTPDRDLPRRYTPDRDLPRRYTPDRDLPRRYTPDRDKVETNV